MRYICIREFLREFGKPKVKVGDIIYEDEYEKLPYFCKRNFEKYVI